MAVFLRVRRDDLQELGNSERKILALQPARLLMIKLFSYEMFATLFNILTLSALPYTLAQEGLTSFHIRPFKHDLLFNPAKSVRKSREKKKKTWINFYTSLLDGKSKRSLVFHIQTFSRQSLNGQFHRELLVRLNTKPWEMQVTGHFQQISWSETNCSG